MAILLAAALFSAAVHVDDAAGAAQLRELRGETRGPIVDRLGRSLAFSGTNGRRAYTLSTLTPTVGYRDAEGNWHGLERRYDAFLDGTRAQRDWRTFFLHLRGQAVVGGRLQLTLDRTVQAAAGRALHGARGAIVALDPSTGGVLALASSPNCPPSALLRRGGTERCRLDPNRPLEDRALQLRVPPGSAFKIVTLSAALDTGRFTLGTVFAGANAFGPSPYFDNTLYPSNVTRPDLTQLTLAQALAFSDNFTFAHIGLTLGARTLLRYAHRYRIGRRIPFDFPVATSSIANGSPSPSLSVLAQSSFGAATDEVTAMQMALIAETVANGGVMMAPHLLLTGQNPEGRVLWRYRPRALSTVMTSQAARAVTQGMSFVVNHGSGFLCQIAGVQVAGKTGTAASGGSLPHAWFIAFAPAQHPVIAVAVLHEFSGEGFKYAAPLARQVIVAALQERGFHVH